MTRFSGVIAFRSALCPSLIAVILATLAIGITLFAIQPIAFDYDSPGYVEGARFFLHAPDGKYSYWRTPLFALFMDATGGGQLTTLHRFIAAQFVLGLGMPILAYFSLSWIATRMAAAVAIVMAATLVPFLPVSSILPYQLYYFLLVLAVFFACRFIGTGSTVDIYASALTAFLAVMARPQGSYVFLVLLAIEFLAAPRRWRHCIGAGLLVFSLQFAYMAARPYFAGPIAPSGEVLLSDLRQKTPLDDQGLYRRALLFVRQNLVDDGRTIAAFIGDPSLARRVRLAAILQSLLNRNPDAATEQALVETDPEIRDQALLYIAWQRKATSDEAAAQDLHDRIGDAALRTRLEQVWNTPPEIPVLTAGAPADGRIEPRPYVTGLDLTNTSGKMLLFPVLVARDLDANALIVPENGPATAELYRALTTYFGAPRVLNSLYPDLAAFEPNAARTAHALLTRQNPHDAHWTLWTTMDRLYGPAYADKFLREVYFEFAARHPLVLAKLYGELAIETLFRWDVFAFVHGAIEFPRHPEIATVPVFKGEIARSNGFLWIYDRFGKLYAFCFPIFITATVFLAACGAFFIRERRLFLIWSLCWLVALHQLGVTVITAATYSDFAYYTSIIAIFLVMAAGISAHGAGARRRRLLTFAPKTNRLEPGATQC